MYAILYFLLIFQTFCHFRFNELFNNCQLKNNFSNFSQIIFFFLFMEIDLQTFLVP